MSAAPAEGRVLYLWPISAISTYSDEPIVEKINGYDLCLLGAAIYPITFLKYKVPDYEAGTEWYEAHRVLTFAEAGLAEFLTANKFHLKTSLTQGNEFLTAVRTMRERVRDFSQRRNQLEMRDVTLIQQKAWNFLNILKAEFPELPLYLVAKKGGHDTSDLIDRGDLFFPNELAAKVPEAIPDIKQGMRCIAFELPTAAGYHLHRANEAVLRRYWDVITNKSAPPPGRGAGQYLKVLGDKNLGDPKLISSLKDLVKLHRNPLAHPEESLENPIEAIALQGSIHAVIVHMLKVL